MSQRHGTYFAHPMSQYRTRSESSALHFLKICHYGPTINPADEAHQQAFKLHRQEHPDAPEMAYWCNLATSGERCVFSTFNPQLHVPDLYPPTHPKRVSAGVAAEVQACWQAGIPVFWLNVHLLPGQFALKWVTSWGDTFHVLSVDETRSYLIADGYQPPAD